MAVVAQVREKLEPRAYSVQNQSQNQNSTTGSCIGSKCFPWYDNKVLLEIALSQSWDFL